MPDRVEIVEVGPRDGLQNEARLIPAADKIALVDLLSQAGFARIEVAKVKHALIATGEQPGAALIRLEFDDA